MENNSSLKKLSIDQESGLLSSDSIDQEESLETVTEKNAIIVTNKDGEITYLNKTAEELTGYLLDDILYYNSGDILNLIDTSDYTPKSNPILEVIESKTSIPRQNNTILIGKDESKYEIEYKASPKYRKNELHNVIFTFKKLNTLDIEITPVIQKEDNIINEVNIENPTAENTVIEKEFETLEEFIEAKKEIEQNGNPAEFDQNTEENISGNKEQLRSEPDLSVFQTVVDPPGYSELNDQADIDGTESMINGEFNSSESNSVAGINSSPEYTNNENENKGGLSNFSSVLFNFFNDKISGKENSNEIIDENIQISDKTAHNQNEITDEPLKQGLAGLDNVQVNHTKSTFEEDITLENLDEPEKADSVTDKQPVKVVEDFADTREIIDTSNSENNSEFKAGNSNSNEMYRNLFRPESENENNIANFPGKKADSNKVDFNSFFTEAKTLEESEELTDDSAVESIQELNFKYISDTNDQNQLTENQEDAEEDLKISPLTADQEENTENIQSSPEIVNNTLDTVDTPQSMISDQNDELLEENSRLKSELEDLRFTNSKIDSENVSLTFKAQDLSTELTEYRKNYKEAAKKIKNLNKQLSMYQGGFENNTTNEYLDLLKHGVIIVDKNNMIQLINKKGLELMGLSKNELVNKKFEDHFDYKDIGKYENDHKFVTTNNNPHISRKIIINIRNNNKRYDAVVTYILKEDESIERFIVLDNTKDINKIDIEKLKENKLENFSLLTKGISHSLNNYFTPIMGNLGLLKINIDPDDKNYSRVVKCEISCLKAISLINQFSLFNEDKKIKKEVCDIKSLVQSSLELSLAGSNLDMEINSSEHLKNMEVDKKMISYAIYNIIANSREAMVDGGRLIVNLSNAHIEGMADEFNEYIKMEFIDNGIGISKENLKHIFDPYFTTKDNRSGLGLTLAYKIIKDHNGVIKVESTENLGTTATVYLPTSENQEVTGKEQETNLPSEKSINKLEITKENKPRILFMDDNTFINETVAEMVNELGMDIELAIDGEQALKIFRETYKAKMKFDLAILDLTIPGGKGAEQIIDQIKEIDPGIKVIVSSGSPDHNVMKNFENYGFASCIEKPYEFTDLKKAILDALPAYKLGAEKPDINQT